MKIGFAGSGNMAAAMARGWASSQGSPAGLLFADAGSGRALRLAAELDGTAVGSLAELAQRSDVVVLAVKPAALDSVAPELSQARFVISVLAATPLDRLRHALGTPVVRTMPTVAAELRASLICHAPLGEPEARLGPEVLELLAELGHLVELADELIDPATAVMGCTPAYLALVAEALAAAGVAEGLDSELARSLMTETMAATAMLLRVRSTDELRRAVASAGGSTEAGLEALGAAHVPEAFAGAVRASLARMRE